MKTKRKLHATVLDCLAEWELLYAVNFACEGLRILWDEHGEKLLAEWRRKQPGTRPPVWWQLDAPGPRLNAPGKTWLESESVYLERHGLLTCEEKASLASLKTQ